MKNMHWAFQLLIAFAVITASFYVADILLEKRALKKLPSAE